MDITADITPADLLQADATIIAGILILMTILAYFRHPSTISLILMLISPIMLLLSIVLLLLAPISGVFVESFYSFAIITFLAGVCVFIATLGVITIKIKNN